MTLPLLAFGADPLNHVLDKPSAFSGIFGTDVKLSVVSLVVAAVIVLAWLFVAASRIKIGPESQGHDRWITKGRSSQVVEVLVEGLYSQMLEPVMGARLARAWLPFLLSLFFFVLVLNLMGLVPLMDLQEIVHGLSGHGTEEEKAAAKGAMLWIGGTATASLSVNMALALWAFLAIQWQSVRELGVKGTLEHLCGGHELVANKGLWFVVPIIFVVEVLGMVIKPAALAIRLFANMVGGHTLMATLLMFGMMAAKGGLATWAVGTISVASGTFALIILFLEVFVAFLQAFIFMFLTAVFISTMSHHDEEHGEDHHEEHGHATAEAHH
jgi:F-type H+-transporting ATPase subunit a